jgi:hypothetical protein
MKRMKMVGLCLVVVFAFGALAGVSSASAAEYGVCVAAKKGKYTDAACKTLAVKKGSFEWAPAGACFAMKKGRFADAGCTTEDIKKGKPKGHFEKAPTPTYTSSAGTATLETPGLGAVVCSSNTDKGQITGPTTDRDTVTFVGCETKGSPCETNPVGTQGEITNELETILTEPTLGSAETVFENGSLAGAPISATFFCNAVGTFIRSKGATGGLTTPVNVMGTVENSEFTPTTEQELSTEVMCAAGQWSGEASSAAACAAVGLPAGPGDPPAGGEFDSLELVPSSSATTAPVAMEIRTN